MLRTNSYLIHGALAGALAAATMTVFRMAAHRAGWIQAMVPQAVEIWAKEATGLGRPRAAATHHVADQLLHLGYGAVAGGVYALTHRARSGATPVRGLELGASLWAFSSLILFPALKIARPLWRATPREELVNLTAHALYGTVTLYLLEELEEQRRTQPRTNRLMRLGRVG
jgi:predicted membrane-bound mannosyltransferase